MTDDEIDLDRARMKIVQARSRSDDPHVTKRLDAALDALGAAPETATATCVE